MGKHEMKLRRATPAERDATVDLADNILDMVQENADPHIAMNALVAVLAYIIATQAAPDATEESIDVTVAGLRGQVAHMKQQQEGHQVRFEWPN